MRWAVKQPPKDVHDLNPGTCDWVALYGRVNFADKTMYECGQREYPGLLRVDSST